MGAAPVGAEERGRLVLVVDDDRLVRRVVRTVLETDEWEVVEATGGEDALRLVSDADPCVVVLDVMMPGIDGLEVCRRLDHQRVKVVMLTAGDDRRVEQRARAAGADAYLTKPFSSGDLLDLVGTLTGP